ncbi:MAG: motility associated factor glycosyltransferase family protein [Aeromonas sobria]
MSDSEVNNCDIFSANSAIVARRWPQLWQHLAKCSPDVYQVELIEGLCDTISLEGQQLTSRHDREAEARTQASTIPSAPYIHLYGSGLGDLANLLVTRAQLQTLQVHLLNPTLFMLTLYLQDQHGWLAHPKVQLNLARDEQEIQLPFFAHPPELALAEPAAAGIRDRLIAEITLPFANRHFNANDPAKMARLAANQPLLVKDGDVNSLFGSAQGREALILAAGPSLGQHLPRLAALSQQTERPLLIAVDTACRALLSHHIHPDVVVSIDYIINTSHLPPQQCSLVYSPLVPTETLKAWRGPRFAAYSNSPLYQSLRASQPKGLLFSGGSVIHPAIDLAVKMGCKHVTLFGADFAFPGNKTHCGWENGALNTTLAMARHQVINGQGSLISTSLSFNSFRIAVERYIRAHPDIVFFNTSNEGAAILGCPVDHRWNS